MLGQRRYSAELTILADTLIDRLVLDGNRVIRIEVLGTKGQKWPTR